MVDGFAAAVANQRDGFSIQFDGTQKTHSVEIGQRPLCHWQSALRDDPMHRHASSISKEPKLVANWNQIDEPASNRVTGAPQFAPIAIDAAQSDVAVGGVGQKQRFGDVVV